MKKYLFIIIASLFLAACGSNKNENEFDEEYGDELSEWYEDNELEMEEGMTDDLKEIMPKSSDYNTFVAEIDKYGSFIFDIKERYISEQSDDEGINDIDIMRRDQVDSDDETFDYKFSVMLAENKEDKQDYLLFVGGVVNNTSKRVQFNHDFEVIMRDIKVESNTYSWGLEYADLVDVFEPGFDAEGWFALSVDIDDIPEELEVKFERAWDEDGAGGSGEDEEYMEIDFIAE